MWPNFILIVHRIQENKQKCNFHYAAMSMMTSQILQFMDFTETQKSKYLQKETLFYLEIKKIINYTSKTTLWQKNTFVAELTFKYRIKNTIKWITSAEKLLGEVLFFKAIRKLRVTSTEKYYG